MAKVLLVDDDAVLVRMYTTRLRVDGHRVETASNGKEALEILENFTPNVIVMDLLMPIMNGFTLIERLQKIPRLQNIPLIVFSSVASKEQLDRLVELGISNPLNKTQVSPMQLVQLITSYAPSSDSEISSESTE